MRLPRKTYTMLITVSVPPDMDAAGARREVRSLVNHQCSYSADYGDVRVKELRSVKKQTQKNRKET